MRFLPYESFVMRSNLKEDELIVRLKEIIIPTRTFRFHIIGIKSSGKYEGQLNERTFQINRIISYRNSFLPQIIGEIEPQFNGSLIRIKMRLHLIVLIFISIWLGVVGLISASIVVSSILFGSFPGFAFVPLGMFVFGYLLTLLAFKVESSRSKQDLKKLFESEIEEDSLYLQ
jgi:hypothetical protein